MGDLAPFRAEGSFADPVSRGGGFGPSLCPLPSPAKVRARVAVGGEKAWGEVAYWHVPRSLMVLPRKMVVMCVPPIFLPMRATFRLWPGGAFGKGGNWLVPTAVKIDSLRLFFKKQSIRSGCVFFLGGNNRFQPIIGWRGTAAAQNPECGSCGSAAWDFCAPRSI